MTFRRFHPKLRYAQRITAALAAVVVLVVVGALLGPSPEEVDRWFAHTGTEGDLLILDDIHVIPDDAPATTLESETMAGATEGVDVEFDQTRTRPDAPTSVPSPTQRGLPDPKRIRTEFPRLDVSMGQDERHQVEMHRRPQQSYDFVLRHFVQPEYPEDASRTLRERVLWVVVAMYVNESGQVTEAYTTRNDGGPLFERAVLDAVRQWEYEPLMIDGIAHGFWDEIRWEFIPSQEGAETRARG